MIEFMGALYNEAGQIWDLMHHVAPFVSCMNFVDDGSTDGTLDVLHALDNIGPWIIRFKTIEHTGLPETVKAKALKMCDPHSWVISLDADERFAPGVLPEIVSFIESDVSHDYTHVWFNLEEFIDGVHTRSFTKCRLFRADSVSFSDTVHRDDSFAGTGVSYGWTVLHSKTSIKQIQREKEYLETYNRLLQEGKIDQDRLEEMKGYHYYIK